MEIAYNGGRDIFSATPETSLGSLLGELRGHLAEQGHVVTEIVLDGELLTERREAELAGEPAHAFALLDVRGASAAELVERILCGLGDAVSELAEKSTAIGESLQAGKRTAALERLESFISDMESFAEGIKHSFAFLAARSAGRYPAVEGELANLRGLLERMHELLVAEEEVEFADLFLYEVPEHLASWQRFLGEINRALAGAAPDADAG